MFTFGFIAIAALLIWAAVLAHNFLEGETLVHDCFDEFMLSRKTLQDLDRIWQTRENRSDITFSLTSTPSRLPLLEPCLKSLLRQSVAPAKIIINIPDYSLREKRPYDIPDFLLGLQAVEIHRCKDWGPATKIIPTLLRCKANDRIIIVDDDRIYPRDLLLNFSGYAKAAFGLSGWVVPKNLIDCPTTILTNILERAPAPVRASRQRSVVPIDILQGLSAYMVQPGFFDLTKLSDYSQAPPIAFYVDDVWISAHCTVPKFVIPSKRASFQIKVGRRLRDASRLGLINRGSGGLLARHNTIMVQFFSNVWMNAK